MSPYKKLTSPRLSFFNKLRHQTILLIRKSEVQNPLCTMASNQPGPHIPSESIASQLEAPKDQPRTLKKEHLDANPGPVILSEGQASKVDPPASKEELQKKAKEMNQ